MASFIKYNAVAALPWNGGIALAGDTIKVILSNTAPNAANSLYSDVSGTELGTANGYTAGGATLTTVSSSQTAGVWKLICTAASPTWTATGAIGPFAYAIAYDFSASSPLKPLLGAWAIGSTINMVNGDTFTLLLDATNGLLQSS